MEPVHSSRFAAVFAATIAALASACASTTPARSTIERAPGLAERYAAALHQTLDVYEAQLVNASAQADRTTLDPGSAAGQRLVDIDLNGVLVSSLESQGLTLAGLNAYAAAHPEFVRAENQLYRERAAAMRGVAFDIMARVERDRTARERMSQHAREEVVRVARTR